MLFEDNIPYATLKVILVVIGTLGMMCSTAKFKYGVKRIALILSLYLCYVSVSSAAIIILFGYTFFMRIFLLTISAPAVYLIFWLAEVPPSKAVFSYATQILFSLYVSATITLINTAVHGTALTDFLIRLTAYGLIIVTEYRFLRRPFLRLSAITESGWLILALIPCSLTFFSVALAAYPAPYTENPTNVFFIYLLGVVIIVIYFSIFQYLFTQYRLQMTKQDLELLNVQLGYLKEKITQDALSAEKSRIDRHDMRHRLQTVSSLMENGNISEALAYIRQSVSSLETKETVSYCKDVILNATLSSYFRQAKEAGIVLETRLSFPETLPVNSGEFSIVIANALENAIKACSSLPSEQRRIVCKCIYKPRLMLEISNPCSNTVAFSEFGLPLSSEEGHGIGTRSIMAFCKKYNALCTFKAESGWFHLRIVL